MLRGHAILAVFRRNVASYFSGVIGYLFIMAFVISGSFLAFSPLFFTNNLATLDQLSNQFPYLLLLIIPAITMSAWADEKKTGADELLFTLPATDFEILLGKYLSVLMVYTITLLFSLTHAIVLSYIGNPDWGVLFTTYLGYWLAGAALLSAGMFASVLTNSATVAFVLGISICAIPVFLSSLSFGNSFLQSLSLKEQLKDFSLGMVPISSVLYFVSLTILMLYLNFVMISKRHWSSGQQTKMGLQFVIRTIMIAFALIALNYTASTASVNLDFTAEKVYSLSKTTRTLLKEISSERPVDIQVFISTEVPREYVSTRKNLIGLLRQYNQLGGSRVTVRFVDVEPSSKQEDEARTLGIIPLRVTTERDGRRTEQEIVLGTVINSSFDQVVIPSFGIGSPLEYELTRSIRTVSNEDRLTVGILTTDAEVMSPSRSWLIVNELKQQYKVVQVSAEEPIKEDAYDVLIAAMPSSLTQPQMMNFVNYVKAGKPVLVFDDPYPWIFNTGSGVTQAPRQPKPRPGGGMGGMMGMNRGPTTPKADGGKATTLLKAIDLSWNNGQIVWDQFNPHNEFFSVVPDEFLFISAGSGVKSALSLKSEVTSGLQEILAAFSGTIRPRSGSDLKFQPLLRTGVQSGLLNWEQFTRPGFSRMGGGMQMTAQFNPTALHVPDEDSHVIAAHITSGSDSRKVNVIYVADVDMISDWFFMERRQGQTNLKLDNVTFILNAVDVLAGDKSYLDLRKRRTKHRTLKLVEQETDKFLKQRKVEEAKADEYAKESLKKAKAALETQRKAIEDDKTMDEQEKAIRLQNEQARIERLLLVKEAKIEDKKKETIAISKKKTDRLIRETENWIRFWAVLIPPVVAFLFGLFMFFSRVNRERKNISADRLVK